MYVTVEMIGNPAAMQMAMGNVATGALAVMRTASAAGSSCSNSMHCPSIGSAIFTISA